MASLPRACIIGAGSSGITAVKAFRDRGIPFGCFARTQQPARLEARAE